MNSDNLTNKHIFIDNFLLNKKTDLSERRYSDSAILPGIPLLESYGTHYLDFAMEKFRYLHATKIYLTSISVLRHLAFYLSSEF